LTDHRKAEVLVLYSAKKAACAKRKAAEALEEAEKAKNAAIAAASEENDGPDWGDMGGQQEDNTLLERHDSELTPKQIVEKDIIWYDLLLNNEEHMEIHDKPVVKEKWSRSWRRRFISKVWRQFFLVFP